LAFIFNHQTHSMEEADALATRTAIMQRRFLAIGTTGELRQKYCDTYHISILLASAPGSTRREMEAVRRSLAGMIPAGAELERDMAGGQIRLAVPGTDGESSGRLIGLLEDNRDRLGIAYCAVTNPTLENVFASVIHKEAAGGDDEAADLRGDGIPLKSLRSATVSTSQ
jgi:ATP-binding cassette, subfamily A (ABC1), member 3